MTVLDERILEYLAEHELATAHELAIHLPATQNTILERLRTLAQDSFVIPLTNDLELWELGSRGAGYLDGRVRADQIVPEPNPRRTSLVLG